MPHYHATPSENFPAILERGLEPRIGPRSLAIGEDVPSIYLFDTEDMIDDAIAGWLGDALEDEGVERVSILEIDLPPVLLGHLKESAFELYIDVPIPASAIRLLREEAF